MWVIVHFSGWNIICQSDPIVVVLTCRFLVFHSDPKSKAELLNNQFSSVFTSEDKINMPELGQSKTDNIPMPTVHQEGVVKLKSPRSSQEGCL
jgi:hypothetical protein